MKKSIIFVDSCCSFTKEEARLYNIKIIPMPFSIDNVEYNPLDDNVISYDEFYEKLENKSITKTSAINPNSYIEYFKKYMENGYDIIYISLSSALSSSYNNACIAKQYLEDNYDSTIEVIDSLTGSIGIQAIVFKALEYQKEGKSVSEIKELLDKNKINLVSLFTIGNLDHLYRGGRLNKVSALVGKVLHLLPIITTSKDGNLVVKSVHRGRKNILKVLKEKVDELIKKGERLFIGYTNNKEEANNLKNYFENKGIEVKDGYIDYTMSSHCGPNTLAVFFVSK